MKKRLSLIFSFLLSCFALSGCGDKPTIEPTTEETQEPTLDHSVELTHLEPGRMGEKKLSQNSFLNNQTLQYPATLPDFLQRAL